MDTEDEGEPLGGIIHIYPLGEEHVVDFENEGICWCEPEIEYLEDRILHIHKPRTIH